MINIYKSRIVFQPEKKKSDCLTHGMLITEGEFLYPYKNLGMK